MRAINKRELNLFEWLRHPNIENLVLVSTEIKGVETACISLIDRDGNDYTIQPLAILVNDDLFPMLKAPTAN